MSKSVDFAFKAAKWLAKADRRIDEREAVSDIFLCLSRFDADSKPDCYVWTAAKHQALKYRERFASRRKKEIQSDLSDYVASESTNPRRLAEQNELMAVLQEHGAGTAEFFAVRGSKNARSPQAVYEAKKRARRRTLMSFERAGLTKEDLL